MSKSPSTAQIAQYKTQTVTQSQPLATASGGPAQPQAHYAKTVQHMAAHSAHHQNTMSAAILPSVSTPQAPRQRSHRCLAPDTSSHQGVQHSWSRDSGLDRCIAAARAPRRTKQDAMLHRRPCHHGVASRPAQHGSTDHT